MADRNFWTEEIRRVVDLIPRAQGETEEMKKARIAQYAGVGRSTLYDVLAGKRRTQLVPVDGFFRMLEMVPAKHHEELRERAKKYSKLLE